MSNPLRIFLEVVDVEAPLSLLARRVSSPSLCGTCSSNGLQKQTFPANRSQRVKLIMAAARLPAVLCSPGFVRVRLMIVKPAETRRGSNIRISGRSRT